MRERVGHGLGPRRIGAGLLVLADGEGQVKRRRREPGLASNPILIGALTVLVTIVAVTLAYNATNGLPFVPTYKLHVQAANAAELTHGTDVNMGGARVGVVASVTAGRAANGRPIALLNLNLYENVKPLPVDSRFDIRLKGAIGLKYLQITLGHARRGYRQQRDRPDAPDEQRGRLRPGAVDVQPADAHGRERLDDRLRRGAGRPRLRPQQRDRRVRAAGHRSGAGRAQPRLALDRPGGLLPRPGELQRARSRRSPQTQATLFTNLDTTFRALAGVAVPSLQETISQTPPTFEATIADSPVIRPFLTDTASLLHQLRPGFATLHAERAGARRHVRHRHAHAAADRRAGPADGRARPGAATTTARTRSSRAGSTG